MGTSLQFSKRRSTRRASTASASTVSITDTHLTFSWWSENESTDDWDEIDGSALSVLTPIRNELMSGDYRALYLGWLLRGQNGELRPSHPQPPQPSNMKRLTGSQRAFAEFLRIGPNK